MRLVAYDGCADLLDGLRRATADKVGPYGLTDGGPPMFALPEGDTAQRKGPQAAQAPGEAAGGGAGAPPAHSTTNSHEAAADEPDLVKTDGRRIVTLADGRLRVIDPATRKVAHTLDLPGDSGFGPGGGGGQLLLSGDRVLVVSQRPMMMPYPRPTVPGAESSSKPARPEPMTRLTLVDISAAPKVVGTMTTEAGYMDARQSGATVRVVMQSRPRIDFPGRGGGRIPGGSGTSDGRTGDGPTSDRPTGGGPADDKKATEANRAAVLKAPLDAWLPAYRVDGANGGPGKTYKPPCDQVSRPASYTGSSMLSVLTFDLGQGLGDPRAIAVTADGSTVYGNGKSLYVTGTAPRPFTPGRTARPPEQRTDVYKFDVGGGGRPRYVAAGSVKGDLLNQYSMSEHQGYLRLATTTSRPDDPNGRSSQSSVYVLGQRGDRLNEVGRVDGLGRGERIYSVRFIGATAYVVTFRQVDPLYMIDLTTPHRPRRTGELKITGYSAYLHPTRDGKLLGVGRDADTSGRTRGLQVSLFDVSGEKPRKVASHRLPDASSQAEFEPHAFLYWPPTGLTVMPVQRPGGSGSDALILKVTGTSIDEAGTVRHPGESYDTGVRRSLVIGDALWTISDDGARATDAATLKNTAWLPFD